MDRIASPHNIAVIWAILVLLLPLGAFVVQALLPRKLSLVGSLFSCALLALMTVFSLLIANEVWTTIYVSQYSWFTLGDFVITVSLSLNRWAAVMLFIVSFISLLVNLFSLEYMKGDDSYKRYFAVLALFTFSMIGIVVSDSLFIIFIFWELVGLSSYLLIGHWFEKDSAAKASKKAFIVNRVGDLGFLVALALCWTYFGTFNLSEIYALLPEVANNTTATIGSIPAKTLTALGITLFIAAIGKSAQFPLQIWLPDAMEGPTPVSALIHAATMVAAGVYLLARVFFLLNIEVLTLIAFVGAITAFMGAFAAITQHDIKKVLAFSTISQLGYMVVGIGVGSYEASLLHLFTHAFFKAGLFLAAGAIIHYLHQANHDKNYNAQDMRLMGGLRKKMPVTFIAYTIFSLALIGVPLFSGFLSKESILIAALDGVNSFGPICYLVVALSFASVAITAFYVIRQLLLLFFDSYRGENEDEIVEDSFLIKAVLAILTVFSFGFIWSLNPLNVDNVWLIQNAQAMMLTFFQLPSATVSHGLVTGISITLILIGAGIALFKYKPGSNSIKNYKELSVNDHSIAERISFNNWYLDSFYQKNLIIPLMTVSTLFKQIEKYIIDSIVNWSAMLTVVFAHIIAWFDRAFIDGIVNSSAYLVGRTGLLTKSVQGGRVQSYIIWAVAGVLIILFLAL